MQAIDTVMATRNTMNGYISLFHSSFNLEQWLSFLSEVFQSYELNTSERNYSFASCDECHLGKMVTADNCCIGLFLHKADNSSTTNRYTELQNVTKIYHSYNIDAALSVFDYGDCWRLSFITGLKTFTLPQRESCIFGDNSRSYKTFVKRLLLLHKRDLTLKNIKALFSYKTLCEEFYKEIQNQYAVFCKYTNGDAQLSTVQAKENRDSIKRFLLRMTIVQLLQSKGYMGGNTNYMQKSFELYSDKRNFQASVLEPLFFGILDTEPAEREQLFSKNNWDKRLLSELKNIPYLNNGLFKKKEGDNIVCDFPAVYLERLFYLFGNYSFAIEENSSNDTLLCINPEMLGRIFENLLEDNKKKGTFYTPVEVVEYMCQESLVVYLYKATNISKEVLWNFILLPEDYIHSLSNEQKSAFKKAFDEVKICDPSIGSGAFPVALLNILVRCQKVLSDKDSTTADIKRYIIKNNIYGVDFEKDAVEITRMRLLFSLMTDDENTPPLVYNIMQGNSLVESFMGIDLSCLATDENNKELSLLLSNTQMCKLPNGKNFLQQKISDNIKGYLKKDYPAIAASLSHINLAENNIFFLWHTWFSDVFNRKDKNGFDIVIGNPPYVGEKGHKDIFDRVKEDVRLGQFYQGKMDYFYFFFHLAFNLLAPRGIVTFITTNYFLTAFGGKKLRGDICGRMNVELLFNFGEFKLFENALGQHNIISLLSKGSEKGLCKIVDVHRKGCAEYENLRGIVEGKDKDTIYSETAQYILFEGEEKYIRLQSANDGDTQLSIFRKMECGSVLLGEIAQVNAGIMGGCDTIGKHNVKYVDEKYIQKNDIRLGDGVFVLDCDNPRDRETIKSLDNGLFVKRFYKNSDIQRFCTARSTGKRLLFSSSTTMAEEQAIIKNILSKYSPILKRIREINKEKTDYWHLLRRGTAHPRIFTSEKIVCPQRTRLNTFGYNDIDWYASADVYYITSPCKCVHIKYLLALLNSKLYFFWLYNKGKRKGDMLELYQKPLSEIPIIIAHESVQLELVNIIDNIIDKKLSNPLCDISVHEAEIDSMVYRIYSLTDNEIQFVEKMYAARIC